MNTSPDVVTSLAIIPSFDALRAYAPAQAGIRITLKEWKEGGIYGGGDFISVAGEKADDGGHVAQTTGFYWERVASAVNFYDYGIETTDRTTSNYIDVTRSLQAAINRAIEKKCALVSEFPKAGSYAKIGLFISASINITGLTYLSGALHLFIKSSSFTPQTDIGLKLPWVVINQNGQYDEKGLVYGTTQGNQDLDTITIYNMDGYIGKSINGQLHTLSGSRVKFLSSMHMNGSGIYFASAFDNVFNDVRALLCGNDTMFGIDFTSYPAASGSTFDESNANTIHSLMAHDCREKSWRVSGSKNWLTKVHEEGTLVTKADIEKANSAENRNGYGYMNSYFSSVGGGAGVINIYASKNSSIVHVHTFGATATSVGNVSSTANVSIISGDPAPDGGYVGILFAKNVVVMANARVNLGSVITTGFLDIRDDHSAVSRSNIAGNLLISSSAKILNSFISGDVISTSIPRFTNCDFQKNFTGGGSLQNTRVTGNVTTVDTLRLVLIDVSLATLMITGTGVSLEVQGGNFNRITFTASVTGRWILFPSPRVNVTVDNWFPPTSTAGHGLLTINPLSNTIYTVRGGVWVDYKS
ncbi:Uncharacterised protein [Serratia proteamaculans]|uniref:hypothetical protein n=1 Tax=Serratia proteamaculans TaxID=28151 RepID=UPI0021779DD4|nr:hypothetical protein [Serratia proteamaculans]CAI1863062.1 Uncharacterised protein [Serratia proteamaculans]